MDIIKENNFANNIGLEVLERRAGYAAGRIRLEKRHMNIYEGMHGGCAYSMADTLAGIAASGYGHYVTTVSGNMNYLLPIANTKYVNCVARECRQGNRIGVYEVEITDDEGKLLCNGSFTFYSLKEEIE